MCHRFPLIRQVERPARHIADLPVQLNVLRFLELLIHGLAAHHVPETPLKLQGKYCAGWEMTGWCPVE